MVVDVEDAANSGSDDDGNNNHIDGEHDIADDNDVDAGWGGSCTTYAASARLGRRARGRARRRAPDSLAQRAGPRL